MKLYKTTAIIWCETRNHELSTLAREAETGDAYCSSSKTVLVDNPNEDKDWDGTDFFGELEPDDPPPSNSDATKEAASCSGS